MPPRHVGKPPFCAREAGMSFRLALLVTGLSLAVGCAAPSADEGVDTSEGSLTASSLREETALDRVRVLDGAEGTITVEYTPDATDEMYGSPRSVLAFEAVRFEASESGSEVFVAGDFPSSATVIVTDEEFHPMARAQTVPGASGLGEARVRVPGGAGGRLVLVRDQKWVKPMVFEVRVGP